MSQLSTLNDLLIDELKDLYSAEKQLLKAIPKMQKGSNMPELAEAFATHLKETEGQVERLDQIGEMLDVRLGGKKCKGMEGVIEEGAEVLEDKGEESICDLAITGAACRVEHYEMAGYQSAISLAQQLGHTDAVRLLQETLAQEQAADKKMRELASRLIKSANTDHGGKQRVAAHQM